MSIYEDSGNVAGEGVMVVPTDSCNLHIEFKVNKKLTVTADKKVAATKGTNTTYNVVLAPYQFEIKVNTDVKPWTTPETTSDIEL